ncbi:MAG: nicotinate (nicotinamide) nucleotide adenylyltransferase [Crocinitomicaceae bacterium]
MKVGLYFGTFNPIHIGHLVIANYMAEFTDLDQVWLVVTPQNPLKNKKSLLADYHRLALVNEAISDNFKLRSSDVEFKMQKPNYTSHTLSHLIDLHPSDEFSLIMGEDNLRNLHKWFNYEQILKNHTVYVYPRVLTPQEEMEIGEIENESIDQFKNNSNVKFCSDAPVMKVSSSFIRAAIKNKKDVRYLLTEPVFRYVDEMNFYK